MVAGLVIIGGLLLLFFIAWVAMNPIAEVVLFELGTIVFAFCIDPLSGLVVLLFWAVIDGIIYARNHNENMDATSISKSKSNKEIDKNPSQKNNESSIRSQHSKRLNQESENVDDVLKRWIRETNEKKTYRLTKIEDGLYLLVVKNDTMNTFLVSHVNIKVKRNGVLIDYLLAKNNSSNLPCEPGSSISFVMHHAIDIISTDEVVLDESSVLGKVIDNKDGTKESVKLSKYEEEIASLDELIDSTTDEDLRNKLYSIKIHLKDINKYCEKKPELNNRYSVSRLHDIYIPKMMDFINLYNDIPGNDVTKEASKRSILETLDNVEYVINDLTEEMYKAEHVSLDAGLQALNHKIALDGYDTEHVHSGDNDK